MEYYVAWWNLENLFDTERSTERPDWLASRLKKELKGWSAAVLKKKLSQLAHVIEAMGEGEGPDLLGVCEVENAAVLSKLIDALNLPNRDYAVIHADNSDGRGIDVGFIYDRTVFSVDASKVFNHVVLKRNATRDIVQATFKVIASGNEFVVMGNHWPSRRGGKEASVPYRMMAGETLAYYHERVREIRGEIPVIAMGDFNDEPFDPSLEQYALAVRNPSKVKSKRAKNAYFFNMMWAQMGVNQGTHSYNKEWGMLDQVLVNRPMLTREGLYCEEDDALIFALPEMISRGEPVRFSRPSTRGGINEKGFSDHLPVVLTLREKS
jgi:predicted extracellular nuclease